MICSYGWDCKTAVAVFKAESGLRCDAVGDGHLKFGEYGASYGIAQIRYLKGRPTPNKLVDCKFNLDYAFGMYKTQGWKPWSAYTNGAYLKHL